MGLMNQSSEAAASGTGGWFDGVTYQAGLSGGSWATTTLFANNFKLPTELINDVRFSPPPFLSTGKKTYFV
jgi:lysophospholipase